jgi:hypothetical protein
MNNLEFWRQEYFNSLPFLLVKSSVSITLGYCNYTVCYAFSDLVNLHYIDDILWRWWQF